MNDKRKESQRELKYRLRPRRIPFYGDSYKRLITFRHKKYVVAVFFLLSLLCFAAAISALPSPFGTEKGDSLAFALLGAFLSVALVYALDVYSTCKEILDEAWRKTLRLYDSSDCPPWINRVPWYFNDSDKITSLIEELYRKPIRILGVCHEEKNEFLCYYIAIKSREDERFAALDRQSQENEARLDVKGWIASTESPINRYLEMKSSALEVANIEDDIKSLPFFYRQVRGEFLGIVKIAENIIDDIGLIYAEARGDDIEKGWGSVWENYENLVRCERVFGVREEKIFSGTLYTGDKYPQQIYESIDRLIKMPLSNKPEDEEINRPWSASAVAGKDKNVWAVK